MIVSIDQYVIPIFIYHNDRLQCIFIIIIIIIVIITIIHHFPQFQSILILTIIKLGEDHDYVANTYSNIAGIYETKAQPSIAHDFYDKALHIRSTLHGTSDYEGAYGDDDDL